MFFLLRMAFWLTLVVLLLPLGLRGGSGSDVSVVDAFGAAQAVVSDAGGFCERQPQACAVGGQMFSHLLEKAQLGAKWLYETVGTPKEAAAPTPEQPVGPAHPGLDPAAMPSAGQLELTPQDLMPAWGGGGALHPTPPASAVSPASSPTRAPLPPRRPA